MPRKYQNFSAEQKEKSAQNLTEYDNSENAANQRVEFLKKIVPWMILIGYDLQFF